MRLLCLVDDLQPLRADSVADELQGGDHANGPGTRDQDVQVGHGDDGR